MSCLFNSLSYFINEDSNNIRQKICKYLEMNKPIIDGLETKQILSIENSTYTQDMRSSSTWGGAIEIQTACNIWKLKINVLNIRSNVINKVIEFIPVNNNYNKTIHITWNGNHYEPFRN